MPGAVPAFLLPTVCCAWALPAQTQPKPRLFFKPTDGYVSMFPGAEADANGRLTVFWEGKKKLSYHQAVVSPSGQILSQKRLSTLEWRWKAGQQAVSREGWRVVLPPSDENGDAVRAEDGLPYSSNWSLLMVEGPNWDKVLCLRWADGRRLGAFDWKERPYQDGVERELPIFTPDGRYFCDHEGLDLTVRSAQTGAVVRRAKNVVEPGNQVEDARLPFSLVVAPDLAAIYFQPLKGQVVQGSLWRWPLQPEVPEARPIVRSSCDDARAVGSGQSVFRRASCLLDDGASTCGLAEAVWAVGWRRGL